jgi:hypothetical protein
MAQNNGTKRVVLVPHEDRGATLAAGSPHIRRFKLARVGVSPRSALGVDRHARLEDVADAENRGR